MLRLGVVRDAEEKANGGKLSLSGENAAKTVSLAKKELFYVEFPSSPRIIYEDRREPRAQKINFA